MVPENQRRYQKRYKTKLSSGGTETGVDREEAGERKRER